MDGFGVFLAAGVLDVFGVSSLPASAEALEVEAFGFSRVDSGGALSFSLAAAVARFEAVDNKLRLETSEAVGERTSCFELPSVQISCNVK